MLHVAQSPSELAREGRHQGIQALHGAAIAQQKPVDLRDVIPRLVVLLARLHLLGAGVEARGIELLHGAADRRGGIAVCVLLQLLAGVLLHVHLYRGNVERALEFGTVALQLPVQVLDLLALFKGRLERCTAAEQLLPLALQLLELFAIPFELMRNALPARVFLLPLEGVLLPLDPRLGIFDARRRGRLRHHIHAVGCGEAHANALAAELIVPLDCLFALPLGFYDLHL
mmetsp:Transcript_46475/g.145444  ORF Transcript_46475/g.145444 Transcript_46475/m.145444 type:complete len:229 (+) Transcript_46475:2377-3063(+)